MDTTKADVAPTPLSFVAPETRFGDGVAADLPAVLDRVAVDRPLVVTDEGVRAAGILDRVVADLPVAAVHDACTEPATDDPWDRPDADFDGLVAVGGGSCLDTAKVLALLAAHGGSPADYLGVDRVPGPVPPVVAVPTTSGTGSQATQTAVVRHDGLKRGISDETLRPPVSLVDPSLTADLPPDQTARSGFDAFVHALESLTARDYRDVPTRPITYQGANPVSRVLSRRAIELVHGALERAVEGRTAARRELSLGAHLAGVAFSNAGLGMVHALASTVGGMTDRPHGECLAAAIEPGLRYNRPARNEAYDAVGAALGGPDTGPSPLVAACTRLRDALELPSSFAALDLDVDQVDRVVEATVNQDRRLATNPRDPNPEDLREVLVACW